MLRPDILGKEPGPAHPQRYLTANHGYGIGDDLYFSSRTPTLQLELRVFGRFSCGRRS
jgi:hypothetical protein